MNIPPRKDPKKRGEMLHLIPKRLEWDRFLRECARCKMPLPLAPHYLWMLRFIVTFVSCFTMGKAHGSGYS
jgi:hypothetical protein